MINEATLEMHYHKPLMDLFRETFGLGKTGALNFYKYSPQKECFVGFDQAYGATDLTENEFFSYLSAAASNADYKLGDVFLGYFLQFKVVKQRRRRSRHTPACIKNIPHFKSDLDTRRNLRSGVSQHELLYKLSKNRGALVYYACPMIFDRTDLYEPDVDLDRLKLVDMDSCPSDYSDSDHHFIYFDDADATPVWCSDPVEARSITPRTFVAEVSRQRVLATDSAAGARELLATIFEPNALGVRAEDSPSGFDRRSSILPLVADSLTIIRIPRSSINRDDVETSPSGA